MKKQSNNLLPYKLNSFHIVSHDAWGFFVCEGLPISPKFTAASVCKHKITIT